MLLSSHDHWLQAVAAVVVQRSILHLFSHVFVDLLIQQFIHSANYFEHHFMSPKKSHKIIECK